MAFIEGIGDEVVGLFVALAVIIVIALLWSTTHVQDRPPVRAVLAQVSPNSNQDRTIIISSELPSDPGQDQAQSNLLDTNSTAENHEQITGETITENPSIQAGESSQNEDDEGTEREQERIKIRFQFLDETSLQVETRLSEHISGLKRRHLIPHLGLNSSNGDNVRLIFNGRVLQRDQQTLEEAGLANNCVVHCLVQRRNTDGSTTEGRTGNNNVNRNNELDISDLDLSNVCYPLLGSVLMAIWWCQVVYAHYFTLTSTLSLVSLTVLYLASAANAYLHN